MTTTVDQRRSLSRRGIAVRITQDFAEGEVINLGVGIPTLCSFYLADDAEVLLHSEHGVLGHGRHAHGENEVDPSLVTAGMQPVVPRPGMVVMDHSESFALIRGGHLDKTVLGAFQVSVHGDIANFWLPGAPAGSVGGAQDLAFCAKKVIVALQLLSRPNRFVNELSMEMTAPHCVSRLVTDIGVIDLVDGQAVVRELVPGWNLDDAQQVTEVELHPAPDGIAEINLPADQDELWNAPSEAKA
ncbi:CoA-transferase [Phytoactinopolyspora limicola]|uniref:CoA-transferase n=1 Tax=Phytoactinopolyspora limicola TaxID=2715536 RepID=UPI00140E5BDF|nr:CoA-transferase [Phytoactinopolyspora limicola]